MKSDTITIKGHLFECLERPGLGGLLLMDDLTVINQGVNVPPALWNGKEDRDATPEEWEVIKEAWDWARGLRHNNMPRHEDLVDNTPWMKGDDQPY